MVMVVVATGGGRSKNSEAEVHYRFGKDTHQYSWSTEKRVKIDAAGDEYVTVSAGRKPLGIQLGFKFARSS
jgi:hypothetical protein